MSNKMIEENSEVGEVGDLSFQIGESVIAFTNPMTEGMIISKTMSEEGRLELTLIVAPYRKRGQAWNRAAITTRDAARLSKKMPLNFIFPIKNVENLRTEAKKAKGDPAWAYAVCVKLDKEIKGDVSDASESEEKEEENNYLTRSSSSWKAREETGKSEKGYENLDERVLEVEQLNEKIKKKNIKSREKRTDTNDSDYEIWKKFRKQEKLKKKTKRSKRKTATSDSSNSSSSDSDSSRENGEVGEKGKTGLFTCPFHETDKRGFRGVKSQIRGQAVIRKHIRIAMQNLYTDSDTLTICADALVYKANNSAYKPFATDVAWLQAYARNIDSIFLGSLNGPWKLWNEPCLDDMMLGFLELMVRVSPNKDYPACLDDGVRKWMKKKRVGTNTKFGPVSYSMQHAKFTESGLQVFQSGWQKPKERNFVKPATPQTSTKGPNVTAGGGEKKTQPTNSQA